MVAKTLFATRVKKDLLTKNPIKKTHVSDDVFHRIAELIISGDLSPGDKFPAEKDWAAYFGVSRLIVRQAIHRLAELSLVHVRQGGATAIADPADSDHPTVGVLALQFSPQKKTEINAFRERQIVGSMGMMILAQRRVKKKDIKDLQHVLDAYEAEPTRIDDLNEQFWLRIAQITKNPFLIRETRFWFRVIRENKYLQERDTVPDKKRIAAYKMLVDDLEAGHDPIDSYRHIVDALLGLVDKKRK